MTSKKDLLTDLIQREYNINGIPTAFRVATVSGPSNKLRFNCHMSVNGEVVKKSDGEPLEIPIRYSKFIRGKQPIIIEDMTMKKKGNTKSMMQ